MTDAVTFGILFVAVRGVRFDHVEAGHAQPYYHIDACYAYQDVKQSFEPYHTEA